MKKRKRILVVDDESHILEMLKYNLEAEDYEVETARNGVSALLTAKKNKPHLILLDILMPKMDGVDTCLELRKIPGFSNVPILFLTANMEEPTEIRAFDAGCDDFITKPIKPKALLRRIKSHLDRSGSTAGSGDQKILSLSGIEINTQSRRVTVENEYVRFSAMEYKLLTFFLTHPDEVFSRDEIVRQVWGKNVYLGNRTIDVYVGNIRRKINKKNIVTIPTVGYLFLK